MTKEAKNSHQTLLLYGWKERRGRGMGARERGGIVDKEDDG